MLEIINKTWCDLIIYTFKNIKLIQVFRSEKFWNVIHKKLKHFYYFYMLPSISYPQKQCSQTQLKWITNNDFEFLDNGLIADIYYYKELSDLQY